MQSLIKWLTLLLPAILTWAVYAPAAHYGFVNYDDNHYFFDNTHVTGGLTPENIRWAFEIHGPSMWIPLTWLSHQAMVSLFGSDAPPHHILNIFLHAANAVLLGYWIRRSTGRIGLSVGIAAVFAIHPIHVESVAWVTERKDVLALFFCLLALLCHERHSRHGGWLPYVGMLICHSLAVMAKPLAVTLPCAMLLWEAWPLVGRIPLKSILQKLPLLAISAIASWLTVLCQQSIGAIGSTDSFPLSTRIANAVVGYATYLRRLFLPDDLAVFYPYPSSIPAASWIPPLMLLLGITWLVWRLRRELPAMLVGWLWFVGTLVPMIGLVQAGGAAMADRYAYFSFIGLYIAVACLLAEWAKQQPGMKPALTGAAGAAAILLAVSGRSQVTVWENSRTLMQQAIAVTDDNYLALNNLGLALEAEGNPEAARMSYQAALAAQPHYGLALSNLGVLDAKEGRLIPALDHLEAAVSANPDHAAAWHNLGKVRLLGGNVDGARKAFQQAIHLAPRFTVPRYDLALLEINQQRPEEAIVILTALVALAPRMADAWTNLGYAEMLLNRPDKAIRAYRTAEGLGSETARQNLRNMGQ